MGIKCRIRGQGNAMYRLQLVNCYQLFHMVPNIVDKKKQMEKVFLQEQKDRASTIHHSL
jgi:hypothetical protein